MNFIFCKLTSLRGAHGVGRGDGAPLGLFFLGYVYDSELEEASDVVDQCCSCNWRCYDEKRIFEYIYCFWYIFEIHNGYVKNRRATLDWQSFCEMKISNNPRVISIFVEEISMLNMYLYLQLLIFMGYKSKNEDSCDEERCGSSGTHILFGKYVLTKMA